VFTLGAILYEMVVGRKAFDAAAPVTLVSQIESQIPANPSTVNSKIQPAVSALIMKALAKDPAGRYQSARGLVDDLEKCKENGKKAATDSKRTIPAPNVAGNLQRELAWPAAFVSAGPRGQTSKRRFVRRPFHRQREAKPLRLQRARGPEGVLRAYPLRTLARGSSMRLQANLKYALPNPRRRTARFYLRLRRRKNWSSSRPVWRLIQ
jgi:serine/threonine protein kinase